MLLRHQLGKAAALCSTIFIVSIGITNAQNSVEAGLSVGFNRHTFSVPDISGILQPGVGLAVTYGVPIVIKRNKWELHTGIYANDLSQAFYFKVQNGTTYGENSYSNGISSYKIPLRIGRKIQWTDATSLSPQIGFAWLTSQRTGTTGISSGSFGTAVQFTSQESAVTKNKFLAEAGMDVNFSVSQNLILTIGAQYSLGLQTIEKMDVSYQIDNQPYQGTVNSKGSGWKFDLALKIPLWKN